YDTLCGFWAATSGVGSEVAFLSVLALLSALWREAYRRTRALHDANPAEPRPPILLPEVVLRRRKSRRSRGTARPATSLAAAMRGDIPADAPARQHPRSGWFMRG